MTDKLHVRASAIGRAIACPASTVAPEVRFDRQSPEAALGTAVHEALALYDAADPLTTLASAHDVDAAELVQLVEKARSMWAGVSDYFPHPLREHGLAYDAGDVMLTGTADVFDVAGEVVSVADYKTGWVARDAKDQLRAYCFMGLASNPQCASAIGIVIHIREGRHEKYVWTRAELYDWWARTAERLLQQDDYWPSPSACEFCLRAVECPARMAELRQAAYVLRVGASDDGWSLPDSPAKRGPALASLREHAKELRSFCDSALELVRGEVLAHGGSMPAGDGKELVMTQQVTRHIAPKPAWPIMVTSIGITRLLECVKVGKTEIEKAVSSVEPRGQKGKAVKQLMHELDEAGALSTSVVQRLELRTIKEHEQS